MRIRDQKEAQSVTNKSPAQILQELAKQFPTQKAQIATARRLPSGDMVLHAISIEARKQLEKQPQWAFSIAGSAEVLRKRFAVLAHGIRTTFNTQNQQAAIQGLQKDNEGLHQGLKVLRVAWLKKVIESNKAFSSLIVEVASESIANRLLDHSIVESNSEHNCVYFEKGCRVLQCFKYYKHGHMTYACRNGPFCHKCGKNYEAETCTSAKNRKRCPSCPTATDHKP